MPLANLASCQKCLNLNPVSCPYMQSHQCLYLIVHLYYLGILQVVRKGPDQTVWRHMLIRAFAVCICLVKGRIQVFAGDGDSAEAPLTHNFNFDYMYL